MVNHLQWKPTKKRTPGLIKVECIKDKIIALCSKIYCCSDIDEKSLKLSCKWIQKDNNNVSYKKFENVLFNIKKILLLIRVLDMLMDIWKVMSKKSKDSVIFIIKEYY